MKKLSIVITAFVLFVSLAAAVSAIDWRAITIVGIKTTTSVNVKSGANDLTAAKVAQINNAGGYIDVTLTAQTKKGQSKNNPNTGSGIDVFPIVVILAGCGALAVIMKKKAGRILLVLALIAVMLPAGFIARAENTGGGANCGKGQGGIGEGCDTQETDEDPGEVPTDGENDPGDLIEEGDGSDGGEITDQKVAAAVYSARESLSTELLASFDFIEIREAIGAKVETVVQNGKIVGFIWNADGSSDEIVIVYRIRLKSDISYDELGKEIVIARGNLVYTDAKGRTVTLIFPEDLVIKLYAVN